MGSGTAARRPPARLQIYAIVCLLLTFRVIVLQRAPREMSFHSRLKKPKDGIVQIATRLGVSPSTVSRALRQETAHLVSAARRKEILDLADRLRFSPNPGARILRRGLNATFTVVSPLNKNIFFSDFSARSPAGSLPPAAPRDWD